MKDISGTQVDIVSVQSVLQTSLLHLLSSAPDSDTEGKNKKIKSFILLFLLHLFCQEVPEEHVSLLLEYMYCGAIYVEQGYKDTDSLSLSLSLSHTPRVIPP